MYNDESITFQEQIQGVFYDVLFEVGMENEFLRVNAWVPVSGN